MRDVYIVIFFGVGVKFLPLGGSGVSYGGSGVRDWGSCVFSDDWGGVFVNRLRLVARGNGRGGVAHDRGSDLDVFDDFGNDGGDVFVVDLGLVAGGNGRGCVADDWGGNLSDVGSWCSLVQVSGVGQGQSADEDDELERKEC